MQIRRIGCAEFFDDHANLHGAAREGNQCGFCGWPLRDGESARPLGPAMEPDVGYDSSTGAVAKQTLT
jgi:hypothetical protein